MISANEELLKQVWINLLDNAVKFAPQNGRVAQFQIYERPDSVSSRPSKITGRRSQTKIR